MNRVLIVKLKLFKLESLPCYLKLDFEKVWWSRAQWSYIHSFVQANSLESRDLKIEAWISLFNYCIFNDDIHIWCMFIVLLKAGILVMHVLWINVFSFLMLWQCCVCLEIISKNQINLACIKIRCKGAMCSG